MPNQMSKETGYEWMKVVVSQGVCQITYRVINAQVTGRDSLDDGVGNWTDGEIRRVVGEMLDVPEKYRSEIEVIWS